MSASKWTDPPFTRFRLQTQETSAEKLARAQENIQHAKAEAERTRLELIAEAEQLGQEKNGGHSRAREATPGRNREREES